MRDVKSFAGLASYYHHFVKNYASIRTHLIYLTNKEVPFEWTEKCEDIFQKFKALFTSAPILVLSIKGKDFVFYFDASHSGLGVGLMKNKNVIVYASLQLKGHKQKYPTHDLEMAAVVFGLKIWQYYLYGFKYEVIKDNRSL